MSIVQSITKLGLPLLKFQRPLISYIVLKGQITPETYKFGHKEHTKTEKLAVVINSLGGDLSQAYIIGKRLTNKAQERNIELVTFGEEFVLNSAFYLLVQGNRVFADKTTYIGGTQQGESKITGGILSDYIKTVVYTEDSSYEAEKKNNEKFSEQKRSEMAKIYQEFSRDLKSRIISSRKNQIKNSQDIDFSDFYLGEEAFKLGLVDGVGRLQETLPKYVKDPSFKLIQENQWKVFAQKLKQMRSDY